MAALMQTAIHPTAAPAKPVRYRLEKRIGKGSFGEIYLGINRDTGEEVAVKIESKKAAFPQLRYESKVYELLSSLPTAPRVHYFGEDGDNNIMVMDLLGPSLEELFNRCDRRFSRKTVLALGDQMLQRIQELHAYGFVHRDVKPENFVMGRPHTASANSVFLIDYGLAKRFIVPETRQHIPPRVKKNLTGTARYASINTHDGCEQSRRDDIESLGYVLVYFSLGTLPWQGLKATGKDDKYGKIAEKKRSVTVEALIKKSLPELGELITYARSLRFEDQPDYDYLRRLMAADPRDHSDLPFDWSTTADGPPNKRLRTNVIMPTPLPSPIPLISSYIPTSTTPHHSHHNTPSYVPSQTAQRALSTMTAPSLSNNVMSNMTFTPPLAVPMLQPLGPPPFPPRSPARGDFPPASPARGEFAPASPARVATSADTATASYIDKLSWHRLPLAQTTRLVSLLGVVDELRTLQRRLFDTLAHCSGPTPHTAAELDSLDSDLQLLLTMMFPSDQQLA